MACYWIGLFGPLVVLFVGNKTLYVQHHAYQGLFVTTALWIICAAFIWQWIALLVLCLFSLICFTALTLKVRAHKPGPTIRATLNLAQLSLRLTSNNCDFNAYT